MSKQQRQADQVMAAGSVRKRKKRRPIGETDPRLHAPERPGYKRRFVNDIKNRIQRFLEAGYEFVQEEWSSANFQNIKALCTPTLWRSPTSITTRILRLRIMTA